MVYSCFCYLQERNDIFMFVIYDIFMFVISTGEKLSKQQLQSNTILKKLRSKEKETESLVTGYRYVRGVDLFFFLVFNANFNNISVISWRSVLLIGETGGL